MSKIVYELRGSMQNIETDPLELTFPRIQTCVGIIGVMPGKLIGMHLTIANKRDFGAALDKFSETCTGKMATVYIVGALNSWKNHSFKPIAQKYRLSFIYGTSPLGNVDVKVNHGAGISASFQWKRQGAGADSFAAIDATAIKPFV